MSDTNGRADARRDVLNADRASNNEAPRSAAWANGEDSGRDYAAERLRALDEASRKRGGFTSGHAPAGGPDHGVPYPSVPKVIRDTAAHVRQEAASREAVERQQRAAQYWIDKIASAPEPSRASQSESRRLGVRA